jgi:hypothetical protein
MRPLPLGAAGARLLCPLFSAGDYASPLFVCSSSSFINIMGDSGHKQTLNRRLNYGKALNRRIIEAPSQPLQRLNSDL